MKLSRLFPIIAVGAIMAACGGTASKDAGSTDNGTPATTNTSATETRPGTVTVWAGGEIKPDAEMPLVIDFNATWCGPCRQFAPVFHQVAEEMAGKARFVSVDVDNCPDAARQFQVSSIPQITILMPDGKQSSAVGYMTAEEFKNFISLSIPAESK